MADLEVVQLRQDLSLEEWSQLILDQKSSGLTVSDWCREHGCSENRYYYWQHKFRQRELSVVSVFGVQFAELPSQGNRDRVSKRQETGVCAVLHGASFQLEIQNGADSETLAFTLKCLGGKSC